LRVEAEQVFETIVNWLGSLSAGTVQTGEVAVPLFRKTKSFVGNGPLSGTAPKSWDTGCQLRAEAVPLAWMSPRVVEAVIGPQVRVKIVSFGPIDWGLARTWTVQLEPAPRDGVKHVFEVISKSVKLLSAGIEQLVAAKFPAFWRVKVLAVETDPTTVFPKLCVRGDQASATVIPFAVI
jgi:hypothetical protein